MLKNKIVSGLMIAIVAAFSFAVVSSTAQAAAGDVQVTVTEEGDSAAISGATVLVSCTGGSLTALTGSPTTNGSGVVLAAPQAGSSCADGEAITYSVAKDGYVTKTGSLGTYVAASNPNVYTVTGVIFALKVTSTAGATVTAGDSFGVSCTEATAGVYYCAIPLAQTGVVAQVVKSGLNTTTGTYTDRTAATDAQGTLTILVSSPNTGGSGLANETSATTTTTATVTPSGSTTSSVAQSDTPVTISISPTVTMTVLDPGCSGSNMYNTSTGNPCNNNVVVTSNTAASYDLGTVTLKNGSKGESVKQLQMVLNKILNMNLALDGKLGPKTVATIKAWQKAHGLKADGLVGPQTKAKMVAEANK